MCGDTYLALLLHISIMFLVLINHRGKVGCQDPTVTCDTTNRDPLICRCKFDTPNFPSTQAHWKLTPLDLSSSLIFTHEFAAVTTSANSHCTGKCTGTTISRSNTAGEVELQISPLNGYFHGQIECQVDLAVGSLTSGNVNLHTFSDISQVEAKFQYEGSEAIGRVTGCMPSCTMLFSNENMVNQTCSNEVIARDSDTGTFSQSCTSPVSGDSLQLIVEIPTIDGTKYKTILLEMTTTAQETTTSLVQQKESTTQHVYTTVSTNQGSLQTTAGNQQTSNESKATYANSTLSTVSGNDLNVTESPTIECKIFYMPITLPALGFIGFNSVTLAISYIRFKAQDWRNHNIFFIVISFLPTCICCPLAYGLTTEECHIVWGVSQGLYWPSMLIVVIIYVWQSLHLNLPFGFHSIPYCKSFVEIYQQVDHKDGETLIKWKVENNCMSYTVQYYVSNTWKDYKHCGKEKECKVTHGDFNYIRVKVEVEVEVEKKYERTSRTIEVPKAVDEKDKNDTKVTTAKSSIRSNQVSPINQSLRRQLPSLTLDDELSGGGQVEIKKKKKKKKKKKEME